MLLIINLTFVSDSHIRSIISPTINIIIINGSSLLTKDETIQFGHNKNYVLLKCIQHSINITYNNVLIYDGDDSIFENIEKKLKLLQYNSVGMICAPYDSSYYFGWYIPTLPDIYLGQGWYDIERLDQTTTFRWSSRVSSIILKNNITNIKLTINKSSFINSNNIQIIINDKIINHPISNGKNTLDIIIPHHNTPHVTFFIITDIFVPSKIIDNSQDHRQLGFQLEKIHTSSKTTNTTNNIENIMLFNEMYYSDELNTWRSLFDISLPPLYTTKIVNSHTLLIKGDVIKHLYKYVNAAIEYITNTNLYNREYYLNDIPNIIGIVNENMNLQTIDYDV